MSTTWFTADPHFGHANIIKYCQRPFLSDREVELAKSDPRGKWQVSPGTVARHDQALIDSINDRVQPRDQFWILGDFCWGDDAAAKSYLDRMVCKNVNFVWGNHDKRSIRGFFKRTMDQGMIKVRGQKIWLNHYPMRSWDGRFHGSWQLYGHVHDRMSEEDRKTPSLLTRDVGVDACNYRPISFDEIAAYMKPRIKVFEAEKAKFIAGQASANID